MTDALFLLMIVAYSAGVLAALLGGKGSTGRGLVALTASLGAAAGIALGASVIFSGAPFALTLPDLLPIAGGLVLQLDALGAFFLILIGLVAIPAAIYGAGYTGAYENGHTSL